MSLMDDLNDAREEQNDQPKTEESPEVAPDTEPDEGDTVNMGADDETETDADASDDEPTDEELAEAEPEEVKQYGDGENNGDFGDDFEGNVKTTPDKVPPEAKAQVMSHFEDQFPNLAENDSCSVFASNGIRVHRNEGQHGAMCAYQYKFHGPGEKFTLESIDPIGSPPVSPDEE